MKQHLITQIISTLEQELAALKASVMAAAEAATHEESKPENQYDTRGLEASYLAGAQKDRVERLSADIMKLKNLKPLKFSETTKITLTALVGLENDGKTMHYFLLGAGAGIQVQWQGRRVIVVTQQSPVGEALLGKTCGDEIIVTIDGTKKSYEVVSIE